MTSSQYPYLENLPIPIEYQLEYVRKVMEENKALREIISNKRQVRIEELDKIQSLPPRNINRKSTYDSWLIPIFLIILLVISIVTIVIVIGLIYSRKNKHDPGQ